MKNEFCTYEQSLALKELGFDESTLGYYLDNELKETLSVDIEYIKTVNFDSEVISAPLIQQAFRFFREKYGLICQVTYDNFNGTFGYQIDGNSKHYFDEGFITYEEAEQACLDKLIELAKDK
jgi:nicotinamide mononucleotide (NMN) deamidase PncC